MGNVNSSTKISNTDRAIFDLKLQRDKLTKLQRQLSSLIAHEHTLARSSIASKEAMAAKTALKRKKLHTDNLNKTNAQIESVEQAISDVTTTQLQSELVKCLQTSTSVMASIRNQMGGNVDAIEALLSKSEDERKYQEEVSQMLDVRGGLSGIEEASVEDEYEQLLNAQTQRQYNNTEDGATKESLPSAPSHQLPEQRPIGIGQQVSEEEPDERRTAMPAE